MYMKVKIITFIQNKSDVAITNDITARLQMFPQLVLTSHQAFFTREALQAIAVVTMEMHATSMKVMN